MRLNTKGSYAIRAILCLSLNESNKPMRLQEISEKQKISIHFLGQIFRNLRQASIVKSVRGPGGGYVLARHPEEIFVRQILASVGENVDLQSHFASSETVEAKAIKNCLNDIELQVNQLLGRVAVVDLIGSVDLLNKHGI